MNVSFLKISELFVTFYVSAAKIKENQLPDAPAVVSIPLADSTNSQLLPVAAGAVDLMDCEVGDNSADSQCRFYLSTIAPGHPLCRRFIFFKSLVAS